MTENNLSLYVKHRHDGFSVFSGLPEFGYELIATLPYTYNLHRQGLLKETMSGPDTKCLYFFSPSHVEIDGKRSYENVKNLKAAGFPNIDIHGGNMDWAQFEPPPLKQHYLPLAIRFEKPTVVIFNRKNDEWRGPPVNFINDETLAELVDDLAEHYQVVYVDPSEFGSMYEDHAKFNASNTLDKARRAKLLTFGELICLHPDVSVNELQCRLYAGCERFISSNGGLGVLASYFGGENIVFSKMCHELNPDINSFNEWYPRFSKAIITVVTDERNLLRTVKSKWIRGDPLINILIRTSKRPNYFHDCIKSILIQDYRNYNIIVGVDDPESISYVRGHPCTLVPLERCDDPAPPKPEDDAYGIWFPFNLYFNEMLEYASLGYVVYLDDDDRFVSPAALSRIAAELKSTSAQAMFWRVRFPTRIVPSDENWARRVPVCKDMSTIGYCHAAPLRPTWEPWKRGDFRVARYIHASSSKTVWLDEVLTELQRTKQDGYGFCDDKAYVAISPRPPFAVCITAYNAASSIERCIDSVMRSSVIAATDSIVLVGIDGCSPTLRVCRKLTRKYGTKVRFYYARENVGTYVLKNSLLKKIKRRDSVIYFFDSDDVLVPGFLDIYYEKYCEGGSGSPHKGILRVHSIDVNETLVPKGVVTRLDHVGRELQSIIQLLRGYELESAKAELVRLCLSNGTTPVVGGVLLSILRLESMDRRTAKDGSMMKSVVRYPHGSFFCDFRTLEDLNFFNEFRVGQDSDFQARAKLCGHKIATPKAAPWFIRTISDESLTNSASIGLKSVTRMKIIEENERRIKAGVLKATGLDTPIDLVL